MQYSQITLVALGIIILCIVAWRKRAQLSTETRLEIWLAISLFIISAVIDLWPSAPDLDYTEMNRPKLEPELSIDGVSSNKYVYHFEIENNGPLKAVLTQVTLNDSNGNGLFGNYGKLGTYELNHGGRMVLGGFPYPMFRELEKATICTLICNYDSVIKGKKQSFESQYEFVLHPALRTGDKFLYFRSQHKIPQ